MRALRKSNPRRVAITLSVVMRSRATKTRCVALIARGGSSWADQQHGRGAESGPKTAYRLPQGNGEAGALNACGQALCAFQHPFPRVPVEGKEETETYLVCEANACGSKLVFGVCSGVSHLGHRKKGRAMSKNLDAEFQAEVEVVRRRKKEREEE